MPFQRTLRPQKAIDLLRLFILKFHLAKAVLSTCFESIAKPNA